jgi:betaine-aldehyde dehydrogenase
MAASFLGSFPVSLLRNRDESMTKSLFINGAWQQAHDGGALEVINPATEEIIGHIASATVVDIDRAVGSARTAFETGWAGTTGAERAGFLRAIAKGIEDQRQELSRIEVADNGKPLAEALWDIDDAAGCFAYYADLAEDLDSRQDEPIELPDQRFTSALRFEAIGVAAQIIPWNYPLLMAAWKVAPALAAGCTMVLKPSELTSLTALNLAQICQNANLPPGVLNVLTGTGPVAGQALASHPGVDKLAFTGSVPTGIKIMTAAAQDIKNVSLELGGKSPFIVFDDADLEKAVEWIMFGIFWNQGQVCSATSRLIVQEGIADRLLQRLVVESERISIGDGLDPKTMLGPLVSEGQHRKVMSFIAEGLRSGARLLTGGGRPEHLQHGYFLKPTIFSDVSDHSAIWTNEIFGPILCVRTFRAEQDAIKLANATQFGLAAAVMSDDLVRCRRVAHAFRAGIVWINCSQPTFSQAPWGGYKSGICRELGRWGLDNYLEVKQVTSFDSSDPWGWYLKK